MTAEEFSNEFDVALASYRRFKGYDDQDLPDTLEFDEYEKSVFLTKAQEYIVRELYNNNSTEYFEATEHNRRYLESLVKTVTLTPKDTNNNHINDNYAHFIYTLPPECWFIVYEQASFTSGGECPNTVADVIPVTHDDYIRYSRNPFRRPNGRKVLRVDKGEGEVELVAKKGSQINYQLRFISRPSPIILTPLTDEGITINGEHTVMTCQLAEPLHRLILDQAVKFAYNSKIKETKQKDS